MKKVKKFFENGRTMLEMLAVLAIIAIIGIGIMAGINHGLVVYKASVLQTQLPQIKKAIETAYSFHQNKYADIDDDINQEKYTSMFGDILGQDACTDDGCKTAGGSFSIRPLDDGNVNGFSITFEKMPNKICYEIEDNTRGENHSVLSSGLFMANSCTQDPIQRVDFISIERGIDDCPGNLIRFNEHEECHCYTEDATRIGDYCYYKEQTPPKTSTTTTEAIRLTSEAKKTESTMASTSVTYASEIISSSATTVHMTETETQSISNTQIHETKSETTTNVTTTDSITTNVTTTDVTTTNMKTTDILTTSSEYISDTTTNNGVANVDGNTNTTPAIYSSDTTTTNGTTTNMQTTDILTTSSEYISDTTTTNGTTTNMQTTDILTTSSEYISDTTTDGTTTYMETTDIATTSSEYIPDTTTNVTTTIPQVTETNTVKTCNCKGCEICKDENTSSKEFNLSGKCDEIEFREIQVDGKLFFISEEPLSWWDARTACNTNGWQMASSTDLTTTRTRELCYRRWGQAGNTDNHLNAGALWLNEPTENRGILSDGEEFYIYFPSNKDCVSAYSSLGNPTYGKTMTLRNKTQGSIIGTTSDKYIYALCVGTTSSSCARTSSGSGGSSSNKTCTCYEACGCNLNTNQLITGNGLYCSVETIESGPCNCSTACSSSNSQGMN